MQAVKKGVARTVKNQTSPLKRLKPKNALASLQDGIGAEKLPLTVRSVRFDLIAKHEPVGTK